MAEESKNARSPNALPEIAGRKLAPACASHGRADAGYRDRRFTEALSLFTPSGTPPSQQSASSLPPPARPTIPLANSPHTDSLHLLASMALGANSVSISALRQSAHDELSVDEEEVDQLDSGLDSEEEVDELDEAAPAASASVSTTVSKPRPKKTGERIVGHTVLPATRVENILQGSGTSQYACSLWRTHELGVQRPGHTYPRKLYICCLLPQYVCAL